jgi:chromatin remodeling complex protein RSC6
MVANTKAKKVSTGKKDKVAQKAPVKAVAAKVEEVVEVAEDIVAPAPEVTETPYATEFGDLMKMADEFLTMARSFKSQVQKLEKQVHRDHKQMVKKMKGKRRRQTDPNAPPSGFAKPGPVSEELSKFLSLTKGEEIARTEVTKAINAYCKKHDLQNQEDKRKIIPDAPLRKLLKLNKSDSLTFFNLQTYLKVHFPNKEGVFPTA